MNFGSVCSGIEAASVAWTPLGWKAAWLAEIEPFPSAVLAHHYPEVPNLGDNVQNCLRASGGGGDKPHVLTAMQVRRLTPRECEALQGFPLDYTAIPWRKKPASECPDGPRYKAPGNSWAVPVVRWIGARISHHARRVA